MNCLSRVAIVSCRLWTIFSTGLIVLSITPYTHTFTRILYIHTFTRILYTHIFSLYVYLRSSEPMSSYLQYLNKCHWLPACVRLVRKLARQYHFTILYWEILLEIRWWLPQHQVAIKFKSFLLCGMPQLEGCVFVTWSPMSTKCHVRHYSKCNSQLLTDADLHQSLWV